MTRPLIVLFFALTAAMPALAQRTAADRAGAERTANPERAASLNTLSDQAAPDWHPPMRLPDAPASARSSEPFTLASSVASGGGATTLTGGDLTLGFTLGEPAVGVIGDGTYTLRAGFWHTLGGGGPVGGPFASPDPKQNGFFGDAIAAVPDVDGDGIEDVLVGADGEGVPGDGGRAYLFSGATGALLQTLSSPNGETGGLFGNAVAGVPDVDGDGSGDLLIGARQEDPTPSPSSAGRAYLFSGATGALLQTLASGNEESSGLFGWSVASAPDGDGDGVADLLVGAPQEDAGGFAGTGRAYLFSGDDGALLQTLVSPNPEVGGRFGQSVAGTASAGLLVGAYLEDSGGVQSVGRAYLFDAATGVPLQTLVPPGDPFGANFGWSVAGVADTDGDGVADLLVGAYSESFSNGTRAGRAYLFSGATGDLLHALQGADFRSSGEFGYDVAGVPDVDGDGRGDLLVGARLERFGGTGVAYLFSGATGLILEIIDAPDNPGLGRFGQAVAGMADRNGDGRGELLVGAPGEIVDGISQAGSAYLFEGPLPPQPQTLPYTLTAPEIDQNASYGEAVASVPDADGDGVDDFAVSATNQDIVGRVYLISGATGLAFQVLASPNASDDFGNAVAGVPDADGDGRGDVLIGASSENGEFFDAGRAYLFSGATGVLLRTLVSPNAEPSGFFGE